MRSNLQSYLGIDFGLSKIGIALSFGSLSEPYKTLRYKTKEELILKLKQIIEKEKIEKIIVGMSEGEMAKKTKEFVNELKKNVSLPIQEFDETLSTLDAQRLSIESGMSRVKRKRMIDALAASVMLQNYLDTI